ncbi:MAG: hypothetical protein AB7D39_00320 [Pseudodesulfovibrio sp.]|uniref:hypothetical protein n=1 Tax=Pseudodesulfovibrio sp. TaxID=2035812 RepID=UPI003D11896E
MAFDGCHSARPVFGAGVLSRLGGATCGLGEKVRAVTGGGNLKRSGTFDRAIVCFKVPGTDLAECAGAESNPRMAAVTRDGGRAVHRKPKGASNV